MSCFILQLLNHHDLKLHLFLICRRFPIAANSYIYLPILLSENAKYPNKKTREIDSFHFTSFLAWTFFKFSGPIVSVTDRVLPPINYFTLSLYYRYDDPKRGEGYQPLIHNFYKDKQSGQVILNLDDLMKSQNNSELKNCMTDLYHMIATYTTYKEEKDCKLNTRKKENFKNATGKN